MFDDEYNWIDDLKELLRILCILGMILGILGIMAVINEEFAFFESPISSIDIIVLFVDLLIIATVFHVGIYFLEKGESKH